ncbi:MAG: hypothetical protein JWM68_949 [Verrucomicrobiales bacterium]|nr:hypothetical protein [Verrucomicrobiales bacterium]
MSTSQFDATVATRMIVLRRERELRQHYFEQIEGEASPRRVPLDGEQMIIGRAEDAAIAVPSKRASRHHAILTRLGTDFVVTDNDSFNGVFLNGVKIYSAILRDGDIIQIADCSFVYREG